MNRLILLAGLVVLALPWPASANPGAAFFRQRGVVRQRAFVPQQAFVGRQAFAFRQRAAFAPAIYPPVLAPGCVTIQGAAFARQRFFAAGTYGAAAAFAPSYSYGAAFAPSYSYGAAALAAPLYAPSYVPAHAPCVPRVPVPVPVPVPGCGTGHCGSAASFGLDYGAGRTRFFLGGAAY